MQDFLKEWGPAIITAVVILILVGIVRFIAPSIKSGIIQLQREAKEAVA